MEYLLLAVIGVLFTAVICVFIIEDTKRRHDAAAEYTRGYRAGQIAEIEAEMLRECERQSRRLWAANKAGAGVAASSR